MRILYLVPRLPYPPTRGDTLRSWGLLRGLSARHEIWLACVERTMPRAADLAVVRERCRDVAVFVRSGAGAVARGLGTLARGRSFTEGYFADPRLTALLRDWSGRVNFDAVLTFSSGLAPAAAVVDAPRRVLDLCDVDSAKWRTYAARRLPPQSWLYRWEAKRTAALEGRACAAHDLALLVNERERRKLTACLPGTDTAVLPTALDLTEYAAVPTEPPADPVVGMVGSMFYPPNVRAVNWFGRQVWPRVRAAVPQARWLIVGSRPAAAVRRWGALPGVEVTGYVPDVRPHLAGMRVFADAVDGEIGVQSKLLVAMAAGRAAVVTPDAAAGIEHGDPPPFVVASGAEAFAAAVIRLLRDEAAARVLAQRARAAVAERYDLATHVRRLEALLGPQPAPAAVPRRMLDARTVAALVSAARGEGGA